MRALKQKHQDLSSIIFNFFFRTINFFAMSPFEVYAKRGFASTMQGVGVGYLSGLPSPFSTHGRTGLYLHAKAPRWANRDGGGVYFLAALAFRPGVQIGTAQAPDAGKTDRCIGIYANRRPPASLPFTPAQDRPTRAGGQGALFPYAGRRAG